MPVVINEFEVIPAAPAPAPATGDVRPADHRPRGESDLERWLELKRQREARVRAD